MIGLCICHRNIRTHFCDWYFDKKSIEQCLKTVFYLVLPSFLIPYLSLSYSHFEMDLLPCSAALFDKAVLGFSEDVL